MATENIKRAAEGSLQNVHQELVSPEAHNAFLDSLQAQVPVEELDLEPYRAQLVELELQEDPAPADPEEGPAADAGNQEEATEQLQEEPTADQEEPLEVPQASMDAHFPDSSEG